MRRVVCAANRLGRIIVLGARHFDWMMHEQIALLEQVDETLDSNVAHHWEQGFIDQKGEFMTRQEAWIVAEAAGQIIRRVGGDGEKLFSENIY